MPIRYKNKTVSPAADAEHYLKRMFLMLKNFQGSNRPDLVTPNGLYNPRFSLEIKSGKSGKVVLNADQFQYAFTCQDDYAESFGDTLFENEFEGRDEEINDKISMYGKQKVQLDTPLYYAAIFRNDKLTSDDINKPFKSICFDWGDVYVFPSEMAFHLHSVVNAFRKTGVKTRLSHVVGVEDGLRDTIRAQFDGRYVWKDGRSDNSFWQSLPMWFLNALHKDDRELSYRENGKIKYDLFQGVFERFGNLEKKTFDGPHGTNIHIFSELEESGLFNSQIGSVIKTRIPYLEKLRDEREGMKSVLEGLEMGYREGMARERIPKNVPKEFEREILKHISVEEMHKLHRLTRWLLDGERSMEEQLDAYKMGNEGLTDGFIPEELDGPLYERKEEDMSDIPF